MGIARGLNLGESGKLPFDVYPANLSSKWGSSSNSSESAVVTFDTPANILHTPSGRGQFAGPRRPSASTYLGANDDNASNHNLARMLATNNRSDGSFITPDNFPSKRISV